MKRRIKLIAVILAMTLAAVAAAPVSYAENVDRYYIGDADLDG